MTRVPVNIANLDAEEKRALLARLLQDKAAGDRAAPARSYIESLGVYLPPDVVSTHEILHNCRNNVTFPLERMTGIKSRRMAGKKEFSIDLARKAVSACLANSKYEPPDIDLLICSNISRYDGPDRFTFEPGTAIKLKAYFGFENALVFDVTNACTGMFTAMFIVDAFLKRGSIRCGMVVSGEYISHLTQTAQKEIDQFMDPRLACLTLGDAGAAVTLVRAPNDNVGFHDIEMYTLGRYSSLCIAKVTDQEHGGAIMLTDTIRSTAVAIKHAVKHAAYVLNRNGWSPTAFQHLIMHQTSETALRGAVDEINRFFKQEICDAGNVIYNLATRGNTATTSHLVALWDNILSNRIRSGDNVIFGISGSGQTVGTALYTLDDLPDRLRRLKSAGGRPSAARKSRKVRDVSAPVEHTARIRIESVGILPASPMTPKDAVELARMAAEHCLERSSYERSEIDLLIHTGVYRNDFLAEPALAAIVAGRLSLNSDVDPLQENKTFAFDIFNSGLGFLNACSVAGQFILTGKYRVVMVVASEIENNVDIYPEKLRGIRETGSALILDQAGQDAVGFGNFVFNDFTHHLNALNTFTARQQGRTYLHIDRSPTLEDHYLACIPGTVNELLQVEQLDISQVKVIFPPQISSSFISRLGGRMNLTIDKFVDITGGGPDLFTSALPWAMRYAGDQHLVEAGDIGLIVNVGAGIQVGCAAYYF